MTLVWSQGFAPVTLGVYSTTCHQFHNTKLTISCQETFLIGVGFCVSFTRKRLLKIYLRRLEFFASNEIYLDLFWHAF